MAFGVVVQIILGLLAIIGTVLYRLSPILGKIFRSSLLILPGPPNATLLLGSLKEIYESEGEILLNEWIEQYGPNLVYRGFFSVRELRHFYV